jgi:amino acid transporter
MESGRPNVEFLPARFSLWDTVCIIVGIIIGVGIFRTPASIFAQAGGPWQALGLWAAGGLLCIVGVFCFAELASTYPRSGGEYVYLSRAFGPWAGFLFAWAQFLVVRTGASIVLMAYVFADYAVKLARLDPSGEGYPVAYTLICLLPMVVLTVVNIIGVHAGRRTQNFLTVVKVLGLGGVLVAGFVWGRVHEDTENWVAHDGTVALVGSDSLALETAPGQPPRVFVLAPGARVTVDGDAAKPLQPGQRVRVLTRPEHGTRAVRVRATESSPWGALAVALIAVLWTYSGWNEGAYVATEVVNKRRNLPRALLLGTAAVIVLYLLINAAYLAGLGYEGAADAREVAADVLARVPGGFGEAFMCVLVMLSSLGSINGMLTTNSRIFAEFGKDHSLFAPLGRWSRLGTPAVALAAQLAICVATVLGIALVLKTHDNFEELIVGTSAVFWLFFLAAGVALFVLRFRDRGIERPFTTPAYPLTPVIYCGFCAAMLVASALAAPVDTAVWMGITLLGVPLYWLSRHRPRPWTVATRPDDSALVTAIKK